MATENSTATVTLYFRKRFVSGLLAGIDYPTSASFASVEEAGSWARGHRAVPVKPCVGGSAYLVVEPLFQNVAR